MDQRVRKFIILMEENLHRKLSLDQMAQSVNLSPSRLCHLFKAEINMSPTQYLKSLRMQEAKHLLETTWLSVKVITAKIGTSDVSHFVRDFRRAYGLTPSEHRAHHPNTAIETKIAKSAKR